MFMLHDYETRSTRRRAKLTPKEAGKVGLCQRLVKRRHVARPCVFVQIGGRRELKVINNQPSKHSTATRKSTTRRTVDGDQGEALPHLRVAANLRVREPPRSPVLRWRAQGVDMLDSNVR